MFAIGANERGSHPQGQLRERGDIFPDDYSSKEWIVTRSLKKTFLGCNSDKRLRQDLHRQGAKTEFTIANFLKLMF